MKANQPRQFLVRDVRLPYTAAEQDVLERAKQVFCRAVKGGEVQITEAALYKTSVDARKKPDVKTVSTVLLHVNCTERQEKTVLSREPRITPFDPGSFSTEHGDEPLEGRPVIVGFGPAGMFCALCLCENGFVGDRAPIIVERGDDVEARAAALRRFYLTKQLDPSSNIQFGAGGAGTFSDGKLVTRVGDPKCGWILRRFVEFGAPEEILVRAKPHVGTDILLRVVANIREHLRAHGCEFRFRCTVRDLRLTMRAGGRHVTSVLTDDGEIPCGLLVLAPGHSARDTYRMLLDHGLDVQPKPFSVGVRIEHLQSDLNVAAYGDAARDTLACGAVGKAVLLPPAEYTVSHRPKPTADDPDPRGVYSFCMCPGGEVMAAASEEGGVVVNGMSRSARDGRNANAALAVSVRTSDYGADPMAAIAYQRTLERAAFGVGGGDYRAPCQTVGDFLNGTSGAEPSRVLPTYMDGHVCMTDLHQILPGFVTSLLADGLRRFERQYPGFSAPHALLTGVETRTSAPVRIVRGETFLAYGTENLYPIGEGAGYAGGITSAALDGLNAALCILARWRT